MVRAGERLLLLALLLLLGACSAQTTPEPSAGQAEVDFDILLTLPEQQVSYQDQAQPIIERRCVVCHGCYDAPCQLKLSSPQGLQRGASKVSVYDYSRIRAIGPTRLFVDAKTTAEWRDKGFHTVLNEGEPDPEQNLRDSVLYRMLRLKQRNPQPRVGMLPDSFELALDRELQCPTLDEFDRFESRHPLWGMPYAMPNLSDSEYRAVVQWLAQGAPARAAPGPSVAAAPQIERWERFLNGGGNKQRLVSRYLYEHLFQAHLHFADTDNREFYRLVRSSTAPGTPVDELATVRPYDDPGPAPFYYRLQRYQPSIVAKNHVVYKMSDSRMARFRELFLSPSYTVAELPSYEPKVASNPFRVFELIPPDSRYRFLLDDARFFIEGFIKGPVCRGQIALNVIEDQFWVFFVDPDRDIVTTDPQFVEHMVDYLQLPADRESNLRLLSIWTDYWQRQKRYLAAKESYFKRMRALSLDDALQYVWDGDGRNSNAALTVFRHFDSASVSFGLVGDYPDTAWIIDFPLLERIHYLLVAGFNVYGNVGHQLNTRLYMDFLRMEGEDNFLAFMPAGKRREIRDSWYTGIRAGLESDFRAPTDWLDVESVVGFRTDDPQREFYQHLERRVAAVDRAGLSLDRCGADNCVDSGVSPAQARVDQAMREIAAMDGELLQVLPDVTFVRVRSTDGDDDSAYTLILNKAYQNVSSMFSDEESRDLRDVDNDTLTVVRWLEGSYPNFYFAVDIDDIEAFAKRYAAIGNRDDYEEFVALYGVRRTNPEFWAMADWFQDRYVVERPIEAGLFDLNRYRNR